MCGCVEDGHGKKLYPTETSPLTAKSTESRHQAKKNAHACTLWSEGVVVYEAPSKKDMLRYEMGSAAAAGDNSAKNGAARKGRVSQLRLGTD